MSRRALWPVYGALLAQTAISAGTYLAAKQALTELTPFSLAMLRFSLASVLFVTLLKAAGVPLVPPRSEWRRVFVLALLGVPLNQGLFMTGLARTTPAHAALMYALTPLFVHLLALAARTEKTGWAKILGLGTALSGAMVVVSSRGSGLGSGALAGDLLVIGATLAWAAYTIVGRPLTVSHGPIAATGWSMAYGTILFLPLGVPALATSPIAGLSAATWFGVAFLVVLTSVVSYLCWYYALRTLEPSRVAVFTNLQPVATVLLARMLFGDPITAGLVTGGTLVLGGVVLTTQADAWRRGKAR